jgi:hypothetical protein
MEPITLTAIAVFLAPYLQKAGEKVAEKTIETLFDARKDIADKFTNLFRPEIISLGLTDDASTDEVTKLLDEKPIIKGEIGRKVENNLSLLGEMLEACKQMPQDEFRGISINAKNIGAVINNPSAPVNLNNTFS